MKIKQRMKSLCVVCGVAIYLGGCSLQPANRNYSKAVGAYEAGNYEEAVTYFQEAIKANPDKAEFYLDYGFNLIQLGQYEEAIKQFDQVIMETDITMVMENNKRAYRGKGIALLQMNNYTSALEAFNLALEIPELKDLDDDILYYKGITLEYAGDLESAIEIYSKLLENNSKDASIYSARANLQRKLGNYEASIADYDKALEYAEGDFELYFGKFSAQKELGKEAEALATLDLAAKISIETEEDKFSLAKVHFYQGNYEAATVEFLTSLNDGFTEANYFLAEISLSQEKYEEAKNYYLAYESAGNAVSATFYNQLMVCYLNLEELDNAKSSLEKAKSYSTVAVSEQLMRNEIILLEKTGDFKQALTKMTLYMKTYPDAADDETKKDYEFLKTRVEALNEAPDSNDNNDSSNNSTNNTESEETTVEKP